MMRSIFVSIFLLGEMVFGAGAGPSIRRAESYPTGRPLVQGLAPVVAPLFDKLESGQPASVLIFGDSLMFRRDTYIHFVRNRFWRDFAPASAGYLGCSSGHTLYNIEEFPADEAVGSWSQSVAGDLYRSSPNGSRLVDQNGDPMPEAAYAPDGLVSRMRSSARWTIETRAAAARLHFLRAPGLGEMLVTLNGVPMAQVACDATEVTTAWIDLDLPDTGDHTNQIVVRPVDERWIQLHGLRYVSKGPGLTFDRHARGGAGPREMANAFNDPARAQLASFEPDLAIVMFDWVSGAERLTYREDMEAFLDFLESAHPGLPVVLVTHHPFMGSIVDQTAVLPAIASERGMGYVNFFDLYSGFAEMDALGFMEDTVHLTETGGQWFADYFYRRLRQARHPADWNLDGLVTPADLAAYLIDAEHGHPIADLTAPWGRIDHRDRWAFLRAYTQDR